MEIAERPVFQLCLDFSNTLDWRNGKNAQNSLTDYNKLLNWSREHGLIEEVEARRLGRIAKESGNDKSVLKRAIDLREAIYRICSASTHKRKPDDRDLKLLNQFLLSTPAKPSITRKGRKFRWSWRQTEGAPDEMLWPIAKSAADLLTSDHLEDVRECANEDEGCAWLFLDDTKNHSRRWCNMETCGNKAKARRFYEAHKKVAT